jgi:hypothetical protein
VFSNQVLCTRLQTQLFKRGVNIDLSACPLDSDKDGVLDYEDRTDFMPSFLRRIGGNKADLKEGSYPIEPCAFLTAYSS